MTLRLPSFTIILVVSSVLRVALILYSEWHDRHSLVKYTDIDYRVFSDAARFLLRPELTSAGHAKGPLLRYLESTYGIMLTVGNPYARETYRYTPLLAFLLTPNIWLHPSFGKYLFAACDILNGILIHRILLAAILPAVPKQTRNVIPRTGDQNASKEGRRSYAKDNQTFESQATLYSTLHLLNPLVFSISTRGSSEAILSSLVLLTLYAALRRQWNAAAILLGLSTHWKIYPMIYGVSCLGIMNGRRRINLVSWRAVKFTMISAGTFVLLGGICYLFWGYPFLYESYLYHAHRLDHRHNFSPYFYLIYLTYPLPGAEPKVTISLWSQVLRSPLASFVPQMALALGTGSLFGRREQDLVFAWFVQTCVFVLFNKVCTSQYFLWYLLFLPLLIPRLTTTRRRALIYGATWIGTQALWLGEAYRLEFLGENVFFGLWIRALIYILGNIWVLVNIINDYAT